MSLLMSMPDRRVSAPKNLVPLLDLLRVQQRQLERVGGVV